MKVTRGSKWSLQTYPRWNQARVENAGLEIIEARITYLAYAPEIAAVMLQRQQTAIDARKMIVDSVLLDSWNN